MSERAVEGISIREARDQVTIEIEGGRWQGTAADAERLLTHLHYALERARPGTNIASVFLNGQLRGAKVIERDPRSAVREMRAVVDQLANFVASLEDDEAAL